MGEHNGRETKPKIERVVQDKIGRELRAMYEELLRQPLPENLTAPLRALSEVQASRSRLRQTLEDLREAAPSLTPRITLLNTGAYAPDASRMAKKA
jgi:hypothetical protein